MTLPFDLDGQRWHVPAETVGVGEPYGDHWRCPRCQATWVADRPEHCGWCCRHWVNQQRAQRTLDLTEPDWDHEAGAWITRLEVAVEAGRISPEEAARAVARWNRGRLRGEAA